MSKIAHYRSIFISDVHLGTSDAKGHYLLDFLQHSESDYLYLVGDIFDLWNMQKGWHWPPLNNTLINLVFARARQGTKVIYIPGNHDERFRDYCGCNYNGIDLERRAIHKGADGRRYLVLHGDEFDSVVRHSKWRDYIGDGAYELLLWVNHWYTFCRRHLGFGYWSLSYFLKQQNRSAANFIGNYEQAVSKEARRQQVDGVIYGHIHHASLQEHDGYAYKNTGDDWVESCTALVEDYQGLFKVLHWSEQRISLHDEALACQEEETTSPQQPEAA